MPVLKRPDDKDSINRKFAEGFKLPESVNRQLADIAKQMVKIELPKFDLLIPDLSKAFETTRIAALKATQALIDSRFQEDLKRISEVATNFLKNIDRHFPDNWAQDEFSQANKICIY
jgi:hypothetical protein